MPNSNSGGNGNGFAGVHLDLETRVGIQSQRTTLFSAIVILWLALPH